MTRNCRVVADIHGAYGALALAAKTDRPILSLGDLVDAGPDSAKALTQLITIINAGRARLIRSNHDDKLFRSLVGNSVKIGEELYRTIQQIDAAPNAAELKSSFQALYESAPFWVHEPPYFFAHGAFHPDMLVLGSPDEAGNRAQKKKLRALALYGEVQPGLTDEGRPIRTYGWVDKIPADLTVIVGHDILSREWPVTKSNAEGGRAIFLDTGAGKGGKLSWIDLPEERIGQAVDTSPVD